MLKDPTVLAPGHKSVVFMTPFNSDWYWSNRTFNVKANEVWSETNVMSELTIPVSLDKMIECMLPEMDKDVIRYNSPSGNLALEYQKSLRKSQTNSTLTLTDMTVAKKTSFASFYLIFYNILSVTKTLKS